MSPEADPTLLLGPAAALRRHHARDGLGRDRPSLHGRGAGRGRRDADRADLDGARPPLRAGEPGRPRDRQRARVHGAPGRPPGLARGRQRVPAERDPHLQPRRVVPAVVRVVPPFRADGPGEPEEGRCRRAGGAGAPDDGRRPRALARRALPRGRPGVRRPPVSRAARPAAGPARRGGRGPARPRRPDDRGGRGDPELRGVHLALPRHLDGAAGPLAAVDRPDRDDPRRPRPARRLEHLGRVARPRHPHAVVARARRGRVRLVLGLPAPGQPVPRRARAGHPLPAAARGRRRRDPHQAARRLRLARRRRARQRALELLPRLRHRAPRHPPRRGRLALLAGARPAGPPDGRPRRVGVVQRAGAPHRRHPARPRDDRLDPARAAPAGHPPPRGLGRGARPGPVGARAVSGSPSGCARRSTSSTGRRSAAASTS